MKKIILTSALLGLVLFFNGCGILDTSGNKDCYNEDCSDNALTREHKRRTMSKNKATQNQKIEDSKNSMNVKEGIETARDVKDTAKDAVDTLREFKGLFR